MSKATDITRLVDLLLEHRKGVYLTCSEDCWCWSLESILESTTKTADKSEPEQGEGKGIIAHRHLRLASEIIQELCEENEKLADEVEESRMTILRFDNYCSGNDIDIEQFLQPPKEEQ